MRIRSIILLVICSVMIFSAVAFSIILYRTEKRALLKGIDTKLLTAAYFAKNLLPANYHDKIVKRDSVSKDEYLRIVDKYNQLCLKLNLQYIWSLMVVENQIVFTSGTSTSKDVKKGDHAWFFDVHTNPNIYRNVFNAMEVQYSSFHDKWGAGRMVLVPFFDTNKRPYLFAASMSLNYVQVLLNKTMMNSFMISGIIFCFSLLISIILAKFLSKPIVKLTDIAKNIAHGDLNQTIEIKGSVELKSLSTSITLMSKAIGIRLSELHNKNKELKQTEIALRESEEKYRLLIENQNDMVVKFDREHRMQFVSPSYCKTFGVKEDHLLGKSFFPLIHQDDIDTVKSSIATLKKPPHTAYHEERAKTVDGWHWFGWSLKGIVNESGKIGETIAVGRDISKRKRAEGAIAKAADEWQKTFDAASDVIFILDKEHRILRFNKTASFFFKMPQTEIVGKKCWEIVHGTKDPIPECPIFFAEKTLHRKKVELQLDEQWHEITVDPILDENGEYKGGVHIITDISDRKQSEQALRLSEEKFAKAFQNAPMLMTISSMKNGLYIDVNEAFVQATGYNRKAAIGRTSVDLGFITRKDRNRLKDILMTEGRIPEMELKLTGADGSEIVCRYSGEIIELEGQKRLLSIASDITESKRLEIKLQQAQKMESIGNLAGGIAHDFNNILFPIIGMSELLLEDLSPESLEYRNVKRILKAGERGSDLVNQILAFSRRSEHKMIPLNVQKIMKEVLNLSRSTIPSNIEITENIQGDCGFVMADAIQLHQVAMNLITNAYHAVEKTGGEISVQLRETALGTGHPTDTFLKPGSYVMLTVSDNGCGISPDVLDKIFDPYFTTKEQGKGTGLGLSVVYGIVKEHGGDIKVQSDLEIGTTVEVYLPLLEEFSQPESAEDVEIHPTGSERILLVDDDESIVHLEKEIMERLGYEVKLFTSSLDALSAFRSDPDAFDLVITDMTMPKMTGDQLAEALISIRQDVSIIICTGFSEKLDRERAKNIGIKGFLKKPVSKSNFANLLRKVLDEAKDPTQK